MYFLFEPLVDDRICEGHTGDMLMQVIRVMI